MHATLALGVRCSLASLAVGTSGATPLRAQPPAQQDSAIVTVAGRGDTTYVIISGIVGGVAGFGRLRARLLEHGHRVIVVDPYRLSLDSAEVTFAALARRTDALLARLGADSARVIGHAHGAGVALRLAVHSPGRVTALYFLDVGALAENRTKVLSSSLRFVPLIARIPGGRGWVRRRFIQGIRQNAGRQEWLDSATQRAYAEPFLDQLSKAVSMAGRLARAREPEPLQTLVSQIVVPVTVILGDVPHPAGPDSAELASLAPLGHRLRVVRLPGVGHFPHEEEAAAVAILLLAPVPSSQSGKSPRPTRSGLQASIGNDLARVSCNLNGQVQRMSGVALPMPSR